jgi:hypothetical protein
LPTFFFAGLQMAKSSFNVPNLPHTSRPVPSIDSRTSSLSSPWKISSRKNPG